MRKGNWPVEHIGEFLEFSLDGTIHLRVVEGEGCRHVLCMPNLGPGIFRQVIERLPKVQEKTGEGEFVLEFFGTRDDDEVDAEPCMMRAGVYTLFDLQRM
ncbi:MAG: hypothetical protein A2542_04105 [Parcubacteria group bacterium RIFOXYD2_FULL_52_8]|nr:MAG: hypothetical protein A2542_04105 [Parcubacteria group bacterium RIFOXYD2_FULL_52_8]